MKKGLLLKTDQGWVVAHKNSNRKVEYLPVLSEVAKSFKLKHNQLVVFETVGNNVSDMKKYTVAKSYKYNPLTLKEGGSKLLFVYIGSAKYHYNIKFPYPYLSTILERGGDETEFLEKVYTDGKLFWENGKFIKG